MIGRNTNIARASRESLREETIAKWPGKVCNGVVITRTLLQRSSKNVAQLCEISPSSFTHWWQRMCVEVYGEERRWPGPGQNNAPLVEEPIMSYVALCRVTRPTKSEPRFQVYRTVKVNSLLPPSKTIKTQKEDSPVSVRREQMAEDDTDVELSATTHVFKGKAKLLQAVLGNNFDVNTGAPAPALNDDATEEVANTE